MRKIIRVSDPELCQAILRSKDFDVVDLASYFSSLQQQSGHDLAYLIKVAEKIPFFVRGDEHLRLRSEAMQFFRPQLLATWKPSINSIVIQVLDSLAEHDSVDLVSDFAAKVSSGNACRLLGLPQDQLQQFDAWAEEIRCVTETMLPLNKLRYINKCAGEFKKSIAEISLIPITGTPEPFIGFLHKNTNKKLSLDEIDWLAIALYTAGQSTKHTLANILVKLISIPPQQRQKMLASDPDSRKNRVESLIRDGGSIQYLSRIVKKDLSIGDWKVAQGDLIEVAISSANELIAANQCPFSSGKGAESLTANLSFGSGMHKCIGANFSRMVIDSAVYELIERFPNIKLISPPSDYFPSRSIKSPVDLFCSLN